MVKGKVLALGIGIVFGFIFLPQLLSPSFGFEIQIPSLPDWVIPLVIVIVVIVLIAFFPRKKVGARGKVLALGIGIIVGFLFLGSVVLPWLGFEIEFLSSPYGYILVLLTGLLIAVSGLLPYTWGKILREVALFCLFILLLLIEINIVKPFVKATKIDMETCKSYFIPSTSGQVVYDALKYTSCVLTGYFPKEEGNIGWAVFYLFYIILPFAFIWAIVYGLMKTVIGNWFGRISFNIHALLSFIIAMYATRTLMGSFLLEFAGYGAWGLGALFLAVFFTKSVGSIMDNWYQAEKMGEEVRRVIQGVYDLRREFANTALQIVESAKKLASKGEYNAAKQEVGRIRDLPLWSLLPDYDRRLIEGSLQEVIIASDPDVIKKLSEFEKLLKSA